MANETAFDELRRLYLRHTGQDWRTAVLGTNTGEIYDANNPGYVFVRFPFGDPADSGYTPPVSVRLRGPVPIEVGDSNIPVKVGHDEDGELAVMAIDYAGFLERGSNPLAANAADQNLWGYVNQARIAMLYSGAVSTPDTDSTSVFVLPFFYIRDGTAGMFAGEQIDLAGDIPIAGQHCLSGLFLKTDDTLESIASTAKTTVQPLTIDEDVQECIDGSSADSLPVWFWRLHDAQTRIDKEDSWLDARQLIDVGIGGAGGDDDSARFLAWRGTIS